MHKNQSSSRREFLATSAVLAGALTANVHAAGSDRQKLRIGLIGCGGRGTGAASQALQADPDVTLHAMGDAFRDRLDSSLALLRKNEKISAKIDVAPERCFVGFDAYKQVIDCCDVVLLCTPPHFRPLHLQAAVTAGKHIFAEKPVAVDAPGVRAVLKTCEEAKKKNLCVVSGLCLRYSNAFQDMVRRIHDGAIGKVVSVQANDLRGGIWTKPRQPGWSDMEHQMRNWYYFTWLSGDFNVEQHVHYLDISTWALGDRIPVRAVGMGGRQVRVGPEYGNIYDHFSVVYEYDDGAKLYSLCRQQIGCKGDMAAYVLGTKGQAVLSEGRMVINGEKFWSKRGEGNNPYQTEHDELFAAIRKGKPINNGEYMARATLMAILGRMTAYTGQQLTWDQALKSKEDLTPAKYEWGTLAEPPVAIPGKTKFV